MEKVQQEKTSEVIEIFTIYFNVAKQLTGEKDYEKRERFYAEKSAANYEDMRKKYSHSEIHYINAKGEEVALANLVKIDASKFDFTDLQQVLLFTAKTQQALSNLKVKNANIVVRREQMTGNILLDENAVITVFLK